MGMSVQQLWDELRSGKEPAVPADTLVEEARAHSLPPQPLEDTALEKMTQIDEDGISSKPAERAEIAKKEVVGESTSMEVSQQPAVEIIDAHEPVITKSLEEPGEPEESRLSETVTLAAEGSVMRVGSRSSSPTAQLTMGMAPRGTSNEADTSVEGQIPPAASSEEEPTSEGMGKLAEISICPQDATELPIEGGADIFVITEGVMPSSPSVTPDRKTEDADVASKDVEAVDIPQLPVDHIDILGPQSMNEVNSDAKMDENEAPAIEPIEARYNEQEHVAQESLEARLIEVQPAEVDPMATEPIEKKLIRAMIVEAEASAGGASAAEVAAAEVRGDEAASTESTEAEPIGVEATSAESTRSKHASAEPNEQLATEFTMPNATSSPLLISGVLDRGDSNVVSLTRNQSPNLSPLVETVQITQGVDDSDLSGSTGAPETPPSNDLCLVCNSSTFIGTEPNPIGGQASGEATLKWIECDNCKRWTHNACVNLSNEEVDSIDKYHCASCEKDKGPSTCKLRCLHFPGITSLTNMYL